MTKHWTTFQNPFRKWSFKTYIYKQKTFKNILLRITPKMLQMDNKQVIVGFGNWGNPCDSITQGRCRGPVQEANKSFRSGVRWWM
jgi:hypothetical protein